VQHSTELDASRISDLPLDASGSSRVVSVQVHGSRSLSGGLRMPTAASLDELCEAERLYLYMELVTLKGHDLVIRIS